MSVCLFLFVCAETDSLWGQRVSAAPCVAYKLIKDDRGLGNCTPLTTFCECASGLYSGSEAERKSAGDPGGLWFDSSLGKWFTD